MSKGRGPTKLMSPPRTFNSSGNSSKLVLRSSFPIEVSRLLSGNRYPRSSRASIIVRNLINIKGCPFKPGRSWRKKTGVPKYIRTTRASMAMNGERKNNAVKLNNKSKHNNKSN